jgi:ABC-2 type transport system ATP-binding protein
LTPVAIELSGLTKSFGDVLAVDDVTAVARQGQVTALLGPNGAGKNTTLRMLLGLIAPTSGAGTFGGRRYDELPDPVRQVARSSRRPATTPGAARSTTYASLRRRPGCHTMRPNAC